MHNQTHSPGRFVLAYLAALATIAVLDGLWLGFVAADLYRREMGALLNEKPLWLPAAMFYMIYPAGLVYLVTAGALPHGWGAALLRGAVIGLLAYGAYDATNLSVLRDFPARLAMIDVAWGVALTAIAAAAAYGVLRRADPSALR